MTRLAEVEVVVFHETDKAFLVWTYEDRAKAVWVPKSQVEVHEGTTLEGPEWLLIEKGLL